MILAGDIGGTKAELGLFEAGGDPRRPRFEGRLEVREHASLEALIQAFMRRSRAGADRAVLGVAGPVHDNRCEAVNLPWPIDGDALARSLGIPVLLLNDLAATAWGLSVLDADDLAVLNPARSVIATRVLVAAGTGLGESIIAHDGAGWVVVPSEGGHSDFGPRDALEDELAHWLRARYGRVSYERILSGPGIADLFRFMGETGRGEASAEVEARFAAAPDPAVVVSETALDGSCERARLAIEKFVEVYGAEAGNLALKGLALGGVYLGGGIAPRLQPFFTGGRFMGAFADKGRLKPVLEQMPVAMILDPRTALWGAAAHAMTHAMARPSDEPAGARSLTEPT